uniref:F-box protein 3 n=1 Tax=Oncorhynchus kisutch TaxID=8019 RepID=A0A8C7H9B6_ONCKI
MIASLKEGAKEELDGIEAQVGCKISNDYRCSYRIHNGQKLVVPGYDNVFVLMGSMALSNHYRSEDLLDNETAAGGFKQRKGMRPCLPLTFCFHTGLSQYMALEGTAARSSTTARFTEWFTLYVHNVVTGEYPIWDLTSINIPFLKYLNGTCTSMISSVFPPRDMTVSVSTSFLPELSSVDPPHFFITYRIRIEMANDALPENACRYWKITNANVNVEEVRGPGVVGEFPMMTLVKVHEYASCTTFSNEEIFDVCIPCFHMVCPPFRESIVSARDVSSASFNKDNSSDTDDFNEGEL